jgi:hypothetical protein
LAGTYPKSEPKIFVTLSHRFHLPAWQYELKLGDGVYRETKLACLPRVSCHAGVVSNPRGIRQTKRSPPPSVRPETPTPFNRPPTTLIPLGTMAAYTSGQARPAPISTVPESSFMTTSLKRLSEMCTPRVDENPRLTEYPEPLAANGVRVKASSLSCGVHGEQCQRDPDRCDGAYD